MIRRFVAAVMPLIAVGAVAAQAYATTPSEFSCVESLRGRWLYHAPDDDVRAEVVRIENNGYDVVDHYFTGYSFNGGAGMRFVDWRFIRRDGHRRVTRFTCYYDWDGNSYDGAYHDEPFNRTAWRLP